jgi:ATP phosphoribosyltransferase regulatory subunit
LDRSGFELIGTRTAEEIAERLLAEVADLQEPPRAAEKAALIERYVAIKGPAHEVADRLDELGRAHNVDLTAALTAFRRRLALIEAAGVAMKNAEFSAEFGRNLEYYTGFVFEVIAPALGPKSPVAGGGRYDSLLAEVGAVLPVPAVGASIHTERMLAVLQRVQP